MFDELMTELTAEMWPFRSQIADGEQVRAALALSRQERIAAANHRIQRRFMEGLGEVVATIDADIYHRLGYLYGYETVNSPDFIRTLLRDNPELRVKSTADRLTLRVQGLREGPLDACTDAAPLEPGDARHFAAA